MSGGKDGQTLFHRILPATARGLTSTTAVDWHLKVENKKCNISLIKSYCITVSMQKNQQNPQTYSADFRVSWTKLSRPFLTRPSLKSLK